MPRAEHESVYRIDCMLTPGGARLWCSLMPEFAGDLLACSSLNDEVRNSAFSRAVRIVLWRSVVRR